MGRSSQRWVEAGAAVGVAVAVGVGVMVGVADGVGVLLGVGVGDGVQVGVGVAVGVKVGVGVGVGVDVPNMGGWVVIGAPAMASNTTRPTTNVSEAMVTCLVVNPPAGIRLCPSSSRAVVHIAGHARNMHHCSGISVLI